MWTLTNISYRNFRLLKHIDLEIEQKGLVIVLGENKDVPGCSSNQGGKSTLLHGITWAMYECDTLGDRITDSAIHTHAKACRVAVALREDNGTIALIQRIRRRQPRTGKPTVSLEVWIGQNHWKGTPDEVQKHIDCTFGRKELFLAAHIFGYEETYIPFARQSDRQKKSLFDLLISSEDLDTAFQKTKEQGKQIEVTCRKIQLRHATISGKIKALVPYREQHRDEQLHRKSSLEYELNTAEKESIALNRRYLASKNKLEKGRSVYAKEIQLRDSSIDLQNQRARLQEKLQVLQKELDAINSKSCPTCGAKLSAEKRDLIMKQPLGAMTTTQLKLKQLPTISDQDIATQENKVAMLRSHISNYEEKERKLESSVASMKSKIVSLETQLSALEEALRNSELATCKHLQAHSAILGALEHLYSKLSTSQEAVSFWEQGFGQSGLRNFRLELLTPRLNELAKRYSDLLFGDGSRVKYSTQTKIKSGEYRDKFALCIEDKRGRVIEACSAGQCMRRDLIHLFAIVKLAGELEKRTVRLLAFDESFRTLDKAGVQGTMNVLRMFLGETTTILVIEHNDDMQAEFDNSLVVTRTKNRSEVNW